jgi:hypothetical protein
MVSVFLSPSLLPEKVNFLRNLSFAENVIVITGGGR